MATVPVTEKFEVRNRWTECDRDYSMLVGQRGDLRAAMRGCPDQWAVNLCTGYIAKIDNALGQWTTLDHGRLFGPNGYGPGIEDACRQARAGQQDMGAVA